MIQNLKALVVVILLAAVTFAILRPVCLRFMSQATFACRRNVWFALTVAAFVMPSFWLYAAIALPLLAWAARRDEHPAGLFMMMLHVIPPIGFEIPAIGINQLFELNNYRILALAVLLPTAVKAAKARSRGHATSSAIVDLLILLYAGMLFLTQIGYDTLTNTLRASFLFGLDALLVYYVFSRACTSRAAIVDAMAGFTIACALFAPIAVFEMSKGWLLYEGIGLVWGSPMTWAFLLRDGTLRAQASFGHALALGYACAIGFGFWLYLRARVANQRVHWLGAAWLWAGLIAAYSRGPWLVGVLVLFASLALTPGASGRLVKAIALFGVVFGVLLISPIGDAVIDRLPFVGTIDSENVQYRQRLAELSWAVIQMNPLFGDPHALWRLEELRQGQGIIDLVNVYISMTLFYGFVGAAIFFAFFFVSGILALGRVRRDALSAIESSKLGAHVLASMVGTLLMLGVGSFGTVVAVMYWALAGLAVAYAKLPAQVPGQTSQGWPVAPRWRGRRTGP